MKGKIVLISCFMLMLLAPTVLMFTSFEDSFKKDENRELTSFNVSSLRDIKKTIIDLKNFYKDNYGTKFILYNLYKNKISDPLNESPSNNKVIYGKENWLFLGNNYNDAFSEAKGELVFNKEEIYKINKNLNIIKSWCTTKNIQLYICVVPGKHTIYKEYLPYKIKQNKTKLDQFIEIYPATIDLRASLNKAKKKNQIYFKKDTHWNHIGAFEGYLKMMEMIKVNNKNLKSLTNSDILSITYNGSKVGDISGILNENEKEIRPEVILKNNIGKKGVKKIKVPYYHRLSKDSYEKRYINPNALNQQKILLLRDSFSSSLIHYFRATFKEVVFVYNHCFDEKIILDEAPDILLYEIGERVLDSFLTIQEDK
ncbi:hypothetical protein FHR24_000316 [Wenyingzhuangia heitensis]|uniref:AlgX/AlgJ SGNH hydrolase-like domain-containing protein n=1 Tax=Wenyingzhuangia heitensis TaxID=1487859 RepID=A0ABX0U9X5_9FLAO|nr:hypothetical protein [Wenyingzhuangia heitensis]NIJ43877.1 hypothetical protein [Wenyingzhuangia heitensis]